MEAGASGFKSQVSSWLGPPTSINWMQLMSLSGFTAPIALSPRNSGNVRPRKPSDPACRKSRRVTPSQKWTRLSASSLNIVYPQFAHKIRLLRKPETDRTPAALKGFSLPIFWPIEPCESQCKPDREHTNFLG